MWKFVTRGIRETLERRASCRTNVYSQTSADNGGCAGKNEVKSNLCEEQKFLATSIVASRNGGFCGSAKSDGPNDKQYQSKWDARRSWSEAVGWSSVLAVGWVVCQSLCLRRRLFEPSKEEKWHSRLLKIHGVPLSFGNTFDLQPRHILPVTNCVADHGKDGRDDNSRAEWIARKPFGPITIEEALKEASDDYTKTHRIVMGEFELRFGVEALEEKRYKDAVKHFSTGAVLSSPGSMFNLGLCHELGIGTMTDMTKAAIYYRNAADRGHPDAMYNLGVFHAQGKGGLSLNLEKARELFVGAAHLGQVEAQRALDMEKNLEAIVDEISASSTRANVISRGKHKEKDATSLLRQISGYESSTNSEELDEERSSSKNSYYDRVSDLEENSTDIFLNSLGIRTNLQPIFVGAGNSDAPYYT